MRGHLCQSEEESEPDLLEVAQGQREHCIITDMLAIRGLAIVQLSHCYDHVATALLAYSVVGIGIRACAGPARMSVCCVRRTLLQVGSAYIACCHQLAVASLIWA